MLFVLLTTCAWKEAIAALTYLLNSLHLCRCSCFLSLITASSGPAAGSLLSGSNNPTPLEHFHNTWFEVTLPESCLSRRASSFMHRYGGSPQGPSSLVTSQEARSDQLGAGLSSPSTLDSGGGGQGWLKRNLDFYDSAQINQGGAALPVSLVFLVFSIQFFFSNWKIEQLCYLLKVHRSLEIELSWTKRPHYVWDEFTMLIYYRSLQINFAWMPLKCLFWWW